MSSILCCGPRSQEELALLRSNFAVAFLIAIDKRWLARSRFVVASPVLDVVLSGGKKCC